MSGKIVNDPVYGFINIPYGIIFDLIEHPYFQRLRRIKQVSLTHYVYPGALHTRFHHGLGAFHLTQQAIDVLRNKGTEITAEEAEAVGIAVLLHDIGHGPFSHTLEHTLINVHHEELSLLFMELLNKSFDGKLSVAIEIFKGRYKKRFLSQLVSGQLDMDRMDYLNRDSFFTGVHEGVISYDRIIKMLSVFNGELVVEEKGLYSIEKFLIARRLMYWQVYLHKTVLSAERMLVQALRRAKELTQEGKTLHTPPALSFFLQNDLKKENFFADPFTYIEKFALLDDHDIAAALKTWCGSDDFLLSYLSIGLINRKLFRLEFSNTAFSEAYKKSIEATLLQSGKFPAYTIPYLVIAGSETNTAYSRDKDEIKVLFKSGETLPMSACTDYGIDSRIITKHYLCYPKNIF